MCTCTQICAYVGGGMHGLAWASPSCTQFGASRRGGHVCTTLGGNLCDMPTPRLLFFVLLLKREVKWHLTIERFKGRRSQIGYGCDVWNAMVLFCFTRSLCVCGTSRASPYLFLSRRGGELMFVMIEGIVSVGVLAPPRCASRSSFGVDVGRF